MSLKDERTLLKKSMSKSALREHDLRDRVRTTMNTGTRTHKSDMDYDRQSSKQECRDMYEEYEAAEAWDEEYDDDDFER